MNNEATTPPPPPPPGFTPFEATKPPSQRTWRTGHLLGAAVVGAVLGALVVAAVSAGGDDSKDTIVAAVTTSEVNSTTTVAPATSGVTTTQLRTTTTAPTTTASLAGTRTNPVPLKSPAPVGGWTISVAGTDLNAWPAIQAANRFNTAPPPGIRYVLVAIDATYVGTKQSTSILADLTISAVDSSNVEVKKCGDYGAVSYPNGLDAFRDVFQNGKISGTVCFAPTESTAESLLLMLRAGFSDTRTFYATR